MENLNIIKESDDLFCEICCVKFSDKIAFEEHIPMAHSHKRLCPLLKSVLNI